MGGRGRKAGSKDTYQRQRRKKHEGRSRAKKPKGKKWPSGITLDNFFPRSGNKNPPTRHDILSAELAKKGLYPINVETEGDCMPMTVAEEFFHTREIHEKCRRSMVASSYQNRLFRIEAALIMAIITTFISLSFSG
mmetsp:Transcript_34293/g.59299  ORF Transcript_34293/g.59299 Transcript_34293/m.59299 type:complete len:136 (-) Transcript_34293:659-1066(-)